MGGVTDGPGGSLRVVPPPPHLVVLVVDGEALAEVAEHLGTVLLELEVAGQVLPGDRGDTQT